MGKIFKLGGFVLLLFWTYAIFNLFGFISRPNFVDSVGATPYSLPLAIGLIVLSVIYMGPALEWWRVRPSVNNYYARANP